MSTHPEVLWAQRSSNANAEKNLIYLTVNLPDITESSLEYTLTSSHVSFKAVAGSAGTTYAFDLDLFAEVDVEHSTNKLTSRSLNVTIRKKELETEYWPRLTKEKAKTPFIKTDFSKWVDEDEQDGNPLKDDDDGFGGVGGIPGMEHGMPDIPGMGGMGGMDLSKFADLDATAPSAGDALDSDSDGDEPPPLEDPKLAE